MKTNYKELNIPCIKVTQPIGEFFIATIKSTDLQDITYTDTRRIEGEKGFETYLGIQRPRNPKRVKEIAQYINTADACFPTAVILAVDGNCAEYNKDNHILTLHPYINSDDNSEVIKYSEIANVLDGQHRIEGLKESDYKGIFEINVSIFIDIDIADQAYIFSTINLAQTKVNKSLVYDLFSLAKKRSPQRTCHNIAVALDKNPDSPFFERIMRLGRTTEGRFNETITQATFVQALLVYISDNPIEDRNIYLKGSKMKAKSRDELQKLIFANMFINEKELEITDIIWNYFDAIKNRWPEAWSFSGKGLMLNKTNGFKALMRFLRPCYLHLAAPGQVPSTESFYNILKKIVISDLEFNTDNYKPGTSGEAKLYRKLLEESKL